MTTKASDRHEKVMIDSIIKDALGVFEKQQRVERWMAMLLAVLAGKSPNALCRTEKDRKTLRKVLNAIRSGELIT